MYDETDPGPSIGDNDFINTDLRNLNTNSAGNTNTINNKNDIKVDDKKVLKLIKNSLETLDHSKMSRLKNVYKEDEEEKSKNSLKYVNYPISCIGLLRCEYGYGNILYGTCCLIYNNIALTCAHILYAPLFKKRCPSVKLYISEGNTMKPIEIDTFTYPPEYEKSFEPEYDYAIVVLKYSLGSEKGYLGVCEFNAKRDKSAFVYGFAYKGEGFINSLHSRPESFEVLGGESRIFEEQNKKFVLYRNLDTLIGQSGSPVFILSDRKENFDVKIVAIDISNTQLSFEFVRNSVVRKKELVQFSKIVYIRNTKGLVINSEIMANITSWINFYVHILPPSSFSSLLSPTSFEFKNEDEQIEKIQRTANIPESKSLTVRNHDIHGKDLGLILSSRIDTNNITVMDLTNNCINFFGLSCLCAQSEICRNLVELSLEGNELDSSSFSFFVSAKFENLLTLNLSRNFITSSGALLLSSNSSLSHLRQLNISSNFLGPSGPENLTKGFLKEINFLSLGANCVGDEGVRGLADEHGTLARSVVTLDLSSNGIGDENLYFLSRTYMKKLKFLDLSWNSISPSGILNLSLDFFSSASGFNFRRNRVGVLGALEVTRMSKEGEVKSMDLSSNDLCTKGAEVLAAGNFVELQELTIEDNYIADLGFCFLCRGNFPKLRKLNVRLNKLTDLSLEYIAEAKFCTNLEELQMGGNDITDPGIKHLSFAKLPNLTVLGLDVNELTSKSGYFLQQSNFSQLSELNMSRNRLLPAGLKLMLGASWSRNLVKLDLSNCEISDEGCSLFHKTTINRLEVLNLKDNNITDKGIEYLALADFHNLSDLNLEDNKIQRKGVLFLAKYFVNKLRFLRLKGNYDLNEEDIKILKEVKGKNLDKDMGLTFVNYSQPNMDAIRYLLRNPDVFTKYDDEKSYEF